MALFNKNKEDKKKSGENIIGKIIYMFLLFAPLLSILTRSLYVVFNKNAKDSYSASHIYQEFAITNLTQYDNTLLYNISYKQPITTGSNYLPFTYISYTYEDLNISEATYDTLNKVQWYLGSNNNQRLYFLSGNTRVTSILWDDTVNFQYIGDISNEVLNTSYVTRTILVQDKLDNVFDYATTQVEKSNLYNWSKTTAMYTVMQTTTTQLGITNTFTPMLLTYWLVISVIYFIYDIALMLIWILHRKIHELTESV